MTLLLSQAESVALARLQSADANGHRVFVNMSPINIAIQPLEDEEIALHDGSLTRSFKGYCQVGTDIQESDRITLTAGNRWAHPAGTYDVKSIQSFVFQGVTHLKVFLERALKDA